MWLRLAALWAFAVAALAQAPSVRVSAWYWLNSAPRAEWERDFRSMRDLGFTHVILCWGLDAAAFTLRERDTRLALNLCRRSRLGAYLMIWHPTHNSLPRRAEFQQKDVAGRLRFTFDIFNTEWRRTQWKQYLQSVAETFRGHRAMAGYVFDDSFGIGPIERFGGDGGPREERVLPGGDQRADWWEDWARDTVAYLREKDPDRRHEIYLEDVESVLEDRVRNAVGLDFGRVARHFDAVSAYAVPPFSKSADVAGHSRRLLERTRAAIGPGKKIIYTFWVGDSAGLLTPGQAQFPTVAQIKQTADAALRFGIRHLDMYAFRVGDWRATTEDWPLKRPGTSADYPLTGQFPGKYLFDRTELHAPLREYLRGLQR